MVALRKHTPSRMTLTEFLSWDSGDSSGRAWQLIDGEPVAMAPGSETHGAIQGELIGLLRNRLMELRSPCRVIAEPGIVPRVRADRNYRVSDLGVTCAAPSLGLMVPEPVLFGGNPVAQQRGGNPGQHLGLHNDPERAGTARCPQHADRGGVASPKRGQQLAGAA
jgi:hypothetical protein